MKTIILTIIATLGFFTLVAAATRITVNQIVGSANIGQVLTTTASGVAAWANLPASAAVPNFADAETPSGTVNGTNTLFTLAKPSVNTGSSLMLTRNGIVQQMGNDYTFSGTSVTFNVGSIPQTGDVLLAWYRY